MTCKGPARSQMEPQRSLCPGHWAQELLAPEATPGAGEEGAEPGEGRGSSRWEVGGPLPTEPLQTGVA